jgi:hypothetical protein
MQIIGDSPFALLFFMGVLVSVILVMLNLILPVIVEAAMIAHDEDEAEHLLERHGIQMKAVCVSLSCVTPLIRTTMASLPLKSLLLGPDLERCMRVMGATKADLHMIFSTCYEDFSGVVDYQEFAQQFRGTQNQGAQLTLF